VETLGPCVSAVRRSSLTTTHIELLPGQNPNGAQRRRNAGGNSYKTELMFKIR
jgi:hypothetical protein